MEKILFLAFTEPDGSLAKSAWESLHAATELARGIEAAQLTAALVGENVQPAANAIADCGADRILGVIGAPFGLSRYASDAAAAEALAKSSNATLIVTAATVRANRALPGVAQRLGGRAEAHVATVTVTDGKPTISRWFYRQRMEAKIQRTQRPWILLIDPGSQPPWSGNPGQATVEPVEVALTDSLQRTQVIGVKEPAANAQTIRPDAALLLVAGAGWTKKQADGQPHVKEAEQLLLNFLQKTRASLGSSKSLVDLGGEGQEILSFLTHLNQIGQTGATPRHPKGLSTCCHGEEPHTVGWRFVNERRAIDLDPNCGWARGKADVLYVADAFAVLAKVNELLTNE